MKYKGVLIGDLSGRIGGMVASHNTYGTYLRRHVKPVNPKTLPQQEQRSAVAFVSQSWRQLDPLVQAAWKAANVVKTSRKGDRVVLTGAAAFSFINILRQRAGLPLITNPPTDPNPCSLTLPPAALTSATAVDLDFSGNTDTWNAVSGVINISGGLIISPGVSYKKASNAVAQVLGPQSSTLSIDLPFAVPIGGTVRLEFHASDPTGRQSTYQTVDVPNPSFPPPTPTTANVLRVISEAGFALWEFDSPITATPNKLLISGVGGTAQVAVSPTIARVTYAASPDVGDPWSITDPTATTPNTVPQSGSCL